MYVCMYVHNCTYITLLYLLSCLVSSSHLSTLHVKVGGAGFTKQRKSRIGQDRISDDDDDGDSDSDDDYDVCQMPFDFFYFYFYFLLFFRFCFCFYYPLSLCSLIYSYIVLYSTLLYSTLLYILHRCICTYICRYLTEYPFGIISPKYCTYYICRYVCMYVEYVSSHPLYYQVCTLYVHTGTYICRYLPDLLFIEGRGYVCNQTIPHCLCLCLCRVRFPRVLCPSWGSSPMSFSLSLSLSLSLCPSLSRSASACQRFIFIFISNVPSLLFSPWYRQEQSRVESSRVEQSRVEYSTLGTPTVGTCTCM